MILCVTGPMAAGKNVASDILAQRGFATVDADDLVHTAIENAKEQILEAFSPLAQKRGLPLLHEDGRINRRAIGEIIFVDAALVHKQESIVYPELNRLFDSFIAAHNGQNIAINATVLYKVPLMQKVDAVLYIDAPWPIRLLRAKKRDGMSFRQIRNRFRQQRHLFSKYKKANADTKKVWNTGTRQQLEHAIDTFLAEYQSRG